MKINKKGSFGLMKQLNQSFILEEIRTKGPISRAEIAKITGLTPASVSQITKELINKGFIKEGAIADSSRGRPPILLKLDPKGGYIIGVNLSAGFLEVVVTDMIGNILERSNSYIEKIEQDHVINEIIKMIYEIIKKSKIKKMKIIGIGMAVHGLVNTETGISRFAPYYHWTEVPLKKIIEEKFRLPTFIDNNMRAMALAEKWFGVAKDINTFITVYVGKGIGSGIVINGDLYNGISYSAGEIGHLVVDEDGPQCDCGNYGCLEAMASNYRIVEKAKKMIRQGAKTDIYKLAKANLEEITVEIVCQAANQGDRLAQSILKDIGRYLGIGIAYLLNILNPEMIVIAGDILEAKEYVFTSIKETVDIKALNVPIKDVVILPTALKENAVTIGAVTLVLKELFKGSEVLNNL